MISLTLALLLAQPASLNLNQQPIIVKDEGVQQGTQRAHTINCTGTGVTCTNSAGVMTLDASGGGGGAPTTAQYVTLVLDGSLSAERVLTGTANRITLTDNGANNTLVLSTPQDIHTAASVAWNTSTLTSYLALLDTAAPATPASGRRFWVALDNGKTVTDSVGPDGIALRLNRDNVVLGYNNTGGVLPIYSVVWFGGGATDGVPHIQLAQANSTATMPAVGILLEAAGVGGTARAMEQGRLTGLNLAAFASGDRIYVSDTVAGGFTTTPPAAPNLRQRIAVVANAAAAPNGSVDIVMGTALGEHDGTVDATWSLGPGSTRSVLSSSATAVRTLTLPDTTGTLVVSTGNVATATALAADPADCAANQYAHTIAASGALTCSQVTTAQLSGTVTNGQLASSYSGVGACGANTFASTLNANAAPTCTQPTFGNLSGSASIAQGGTTETASTEDAVLVGASTTDWQAKVLPSCSNATTSKLLYDTATNAFSCGTDQTGGGGGEMLARVSSDVANSTTAFADVTGLTFSVLTGTTYALHCNLTYNTAATTTALQLSTNGPTASAIDYYVFTNTTATAKHDAVQVAYNTATNPATGGGTVRLGARVDGTFVFTASGTLALRFRSEINASAVTVKRGSWCSLKAL